MISQKRPPTMHHRTEKTKKGVPVMMAAVMTHTLKPISLQQKQNGRKSVATKLKAKRIRNTIEANIAGKLKILQTTISFAP
mmetsp:Transcript_42088/g.116282  ORF Transcript_42088/g.116282 Transcript_42088/m.116282 type:complete len:81 (-) Transcript_42088:1283-1525(-)